MNSTTYRIDTSNPTKEATKPRAAYPFIIAATRLRNGKWAVAPEGQLGTMGWHPAPWEVAIVTAPNALAACQRAIAKTERYSASKPSTQPEAI